MIGLAQRQLFDSPELLLWRQAPIARWRPALQVLLRAGFTSSCWAAALAAPFLVAVLRHHDASPLGYAMLPVAIVGATLPLLAILLAVQIVLMRFFAGRWLRLLLATAGALASVGFSKSGVARNDSAPVPPSMRNSAASAPPAMP